MGKKWFQHDEVMAGVKRLGLSRRLYELFGEFPLRLISFFVATHAFLCAKERRDCSNKFFSVLSKHTNTRFFPYINSYRLFLNYADSLVDKIISFSGRLSAEKFCFCGDEFENLIKDKKGIFFLTTHIGNVEILRSLLQSKNPVKPPKVNIFLEKRSCEVFNSFLNGFKTDFNSIEVHPVEEIDVSTAIEMSDKLKNGEIIFMAGDRVAKDNSQKTYETDFLSQKISLPQGALRFAQMLDTTIFFIICVKVNKKFVVISEKFNPESENKKEIFENLKVQYRDFLEKYTLKYPHQFFNFYDLFNRLV